MVGYFILHIFAEITNKKKEMEKIIIMLILGVINGVMGILEVKKGKFDNGTMFLFFASGFAIASALSLIK